MTIQIDTQQEATDEWLVLEARQGSGQAFAELVTRYQHRAYATAVGVLSDFELAQDVAQDAFLCAYRDLSKLKEPALFATWLSGIARYTAHAARRERGKIESAIRALPG